MEKGECFVVVLGRELKTAKDVDLFAMALEAGAMAEGTVIVDLSRVSSLTTDMLNLLAAPRGNHDKLPWLVGPLSSLVYKRLIQSGTFDSFRLFSSVESATGESA
ncbi:hypothetical protein ACFYVL_14205 [Streptomyces sp. NPDC004111]|uniref:hypothetical protein n=1 Tax=Streptomyces sp. NPDC004111 TaxID=3364690 RepID=UPI0036960E53